MKTLFGTTFDFVASLGEDCACALYLRKYGLRDCSSPMDWVFKASFETRIDMVCGGFAGYVEKEDLRMLQKDPGYLQDHANDAYENTRNGFWFVHDFPAGIPFDKAYGLVRTIYDRRAKRFMARASSARNALFVWWSKDKYIPDDVLAHSLERLSKTFPETDVRLLVFENDLSIAEPELSRPSPRIIRARGPFVPVAGITMGDQRACGKVFSKIRRRGMRRDAAKRLLAEIAVRIVSGMHLSRKARRAAKKRLSEKWIGHA